MDTWAGREEETVTLNKYLYANANPIVYMDPSGNLSVLSQIGTLALVGTLASSAHASPIILGGPGAVSPGSQVTSLRPRFSDLYTHFLDAPADIVYSTIGGKVEWNHVQQPEHFANACALRVSRSINYSGVRIPFEANKTGSGSDGNWYYYRVIDLNRYMERTFGSPNIEQSKPVSKLDFVGLKGIMIFDTRPSPGERQLWSDATGHADLWNGVSCGHSCYFKESRSVRLWTMP